VQGPLTEPGNAYPTRVLPLSDWGAGLHLDAEPGEGRENVSPLPSERRGQGSESRPVRQRRAKKANI